MATRYKLSKDQLERVVENFVMEAASAKATVKNHIPSQGSEAKKHVKNKISGKIVDKSEGMPSVTPMKKKLSHAPESKKFVSNSKMTHSNKAKVVKENEENEENKENKENKIMTHLKSILNTVGVDKIKSALEKEGITTKEEAKEAAKEAIKMSGVNEEGLKMKIGGGLMVAALTGLGIVGHLQSTLADALSHDTVIQHMLNNPTFVGSLAAAIAGIALVVKGRQEVNKVESSKAVLDTVNLAKKTGYTQLVSGDVDGGKFPIIFLNPKSNKKVSISTDGSSKAVN